MQHGSFWARRLHSLSGVVPIGAFLIEHLYSNSYSRQGAEAYNEMVAGLQSLPYVLWLEVFFIWLPILFHAVYGTAIALEARYNQVQYPYGRNWMFMLQRVTGVFLFLYIALHFWETRAQVFFDESIKHRFFEHMQELLSSPPYLALYLAGVLSAAFHFANGLWTFGIVWGITADRGAQRLSTYACAGIGVVVAAMGVNSLLGFLGP
ncbi:MAG TPA: succinate dehydrogenase cytochrome b558 subunit [Candidatus Polarisedimenticolia bacterium]|nr:succinate dehydrogenase cytochrome b558 subunit [Candidatus Polarisedimenticolia bacterium]